MAEESEDIVLKASQVINDFIAARESIMRAEEKLSREFSEKIGVVRSRSESVLEMLKRVHALIPASREDYFKKSEGLLKTFLFDLGYAIEDAGLAEIKTACTSLTEGICQEPFSLLENAIQGTRRLLFPKPPRFQKTLSVDTGKQVNLVVVYDSTKTGFDTHVKQVSEIFLTYGVMHEKSLHEVFDIASNLLEQAIQITFRAHLFERFFGKTFKTTVHVYVAGKKSTEHAGGFAPVFSRLLDFKKRGLDKEYVIVKITPSHEDIRIVFLLNNLKEWTVQRLTELFLHEITHVLDTHLREGQADKNILNIILTEIRREGLASFAEFIEVPDLLSKYLHAFGPHYLNIKPGMIKEIDDLTKHKWASKYFFGVLIMLQLFLALTKKYNDNEDVLQDKEKLKEYLVRYKQDAVDVLNILLSANLRQFYGFYFLKVKNSLFSPEFKNKIILSLSTRKE